MRKVDGGLRALSQWVADEGKEFLVGGEFGLADVAAGSVLGYMKVCAFVSEPGPRYYGEMTLCLRPGARQALTCDNRYVLPITAGRKSTRT